MRQKANKQTKIFLTGQFTKMFKHTVSTRCY